MEAACSQDPCLVLEASQVSPTSSASKLSSTRPTPSLLACSMTCASAMHRVVEPIAKRWCRLFALLGGQSCRFDTTERFGLSHRYEPVRCAPIHFDDPQELAQLS